MHSSIAVPELAISLFTSVVPGQETEDNISVNLSIFKLNPVFSLSFKRMAFHYVKAAK